MRNRLTSRAEHRPMDFDTFWSGVRRARAADSRGLVIFNRIPSSHDVARRAAREYQAEGGSVPASDFVAWQQTEGRGRHSRRWSSPAGAGVYVSMVRRLGASRIQALPITVPTALAITLQEAAGVHCKVKWPNDLMIGDKKLGGILIDVMTSGDGDPVAVISFGVNHGSSSSFSEDRAVSVTEQGSNLDLDELAVALMAGVDRNIEQVEQVSDVLPAYRALSTHVPGDRLECQIERGSSELTRGIFLGIDSQGLLRLNVDGEERLLSAGRLVGS